MIIRGFKIIKDVVNDVLLDTDKKDLKVKRNHLFTKDGLLSLENLVEVEAIVDNKPFRFYVINDKEIS